MGKQNLKTKFGRKNFGNENSKAKKFESKNSRSNLGDKDFKNYFRRKKLEVKILEAKLNT